MDTTAIEARLHKIKSAVQALYELQPLTYDEFCANILYESTVERQFQVAIQAVIDIGEYILASVASERPADYADVFSKLAEIGVIPEPFGRQLAQMARFRNILVHMYLDIDLEKVYDYLQHNLGDFDTYAAHVVAYIDRTSGTDQP